MRGVYRALKPNGTFWLAIGDEYAAELKIEAQKAGFHCRSWVIWYYTFGVNCVNGFSRSHTHLFHFVKNPKEFTFNRFNPQIRVKSARQLVYADNRANPNGRLPDNTWITRPQDAPLSFSPNHDTWYFARVAGTFKEREGFHGCQMPEQLLARIIRASSHPQDLCWIRLVAAEPRCALPKNWDGNGWDSSFPRSMPSTLTTGSTTHPLVIQSTVLKIQSKSAPNSNQGKRRTKPFDEDTEKAVIDAYRRLAKVIRQTTLCATKKSTKNSSPNVLKEELAVTPTFGISFC